MKLLFIHEVNYEKKVIFEIQEFPELLSLRGHEIDFLHFPEHVSIKNASLRTKIKKIRGRVYEDAELNLITPPTVGGTFAERLLASILIIPLLWRLISRNKYDAVVLYSVPTSGWQTALIAKIKGVPVIFRALDVSHLLRSGLTEQLVRVAERIVYRNVNLISANNSALGSYCRYISRKPLPMEVNVPPLDFAHFQVSEKTPNLRSKYGLASSDFILMFMGTFYEFSGIPKVIKSVADSADASIKVVLVGGGKQEELIRRQISDLNISDRVICTGVIPYSDLPEVLSMADVTFNSFEPILISNVAFPHKVLQYLAAGKLTISTKLDGLFSSLGENAGVKWVNKPEEILQAATSLRNLSTSEKSKIIQTGKEFIFSHFAKVESVTSFEQTIKRASSGN
jgi:glycosyltransferase involved in cell wall biosynthesis